MLRNIHAHWVSPGVILTTLARFFSFASLEISRFIGTDGAKRLEFFQRHLWLAPLAVAVALVGFVHPVWMLVDACRPSRQWPASLPGTRWRIAAPHRGRGRAARLRQLLVRDGAAAGARVLSAGAARADVRRLLVVVRRFTARPRRSRRSSSPSTSCSTPGWRGRRRRSCRSTQRRDVVVAAIRLKEPQMFAHRREFAVDGGPAVLDAASGRYNPPQRLRSRRGEVPPGPATIAALDDHDPQSQPARRLSRSAVLHHLLRRARQGRRRAARAA